MSLSIAPDKLLADADAMLRVWKANPELKLKEVGLEGYEQTRGQLQVAVGEVTELESRLSVTMMERDKLAEALNEMNTRLRSAGRGYFGPDSAEYEQLGGTRSSDRKRRGAKQPAPVVTK
jgi:hypothetical protein